MHVHAARVRFSLTSLVCCLILASSAICGQESPQAAELRSSPLDFTVTSIRPSNTHASGWRMEFTLDGFLAQNVPLQMMVMEAYDAYMPGALADGPAWVGKDHFDIRAKLNAEDVPGYANLTLAQRRRMLASMLQHRFGLKMHEEQQLQNVFLLETTATGQKLTPSHETLHLGSVSGYSSLVTRSLPGLLEGKNFSLTELAGLLQNEVHRPVVNETGLTGRFDFGLHWTPERSYSSSGSTEDPANIASPDFFTAVREQLGLRLLAARRPVRVLVIDGAHRPSDN